MSAAVPGTWPIRVAGEEIVLTAFAVMRTTQTQSGSTRKTRRTTGAIVEECLRPSNFPYSPLQHFTFYLPFTSAFFTVSSHFFPGEGELGGVDIR